MEENPLDPDPPQPKPKKEETSSANQGGERSEDICFL